MKMVMVICPQNRRDDLRALIARHAVHSYSEIREVAGAGATGQRLGTQVWPETSALVFSVVPNEKKDELMAALRECAHSLYPGEGLRAFVLPVEEMI